MEHSRSPYVTLTFKDQIQKNFPRGVLLQDVLMDVFPEKKRIPLIAMVNQLPYSLSSRIDFNANIDFVGIENIEGIRAYRRTTCFLAIHAVRELFPKEQFRVEHSLQGSFYCSLTSHVTKESLTQIVNKMKEIVEADIPIYKEVLPLEQALEIFKQNGEEDRVLLFHHLGRPTIELYNLNNFRDFFYGPLLASTGMIKTFKLMLYPPGFLIRVPTTPQPFKIQPLKEHHKFFKTLRDNEHWGKDLKVNNVGLLNQMISTGEISDFIKISEALHEKKLGYIADMITSQKIVPRVILISGPTASGKTTFSKRLALHLRINGIRIKTLSLDNYFVDRDKNPRGADGNYDFEALEALDLKLINEHLTSLLAGKEIEVPRYNFPKGMREPVGDKFVLEEDESIIIEGIHGLNPNLTKAIDSKYKFKIYVSALTQLNLDNYNRVSNTNVRMIRRMVRDNRCRGYSSNETLLRWTSIREGEFKYIYPYQETSEVIFNSALLYELAVLKTFAEPLLRQIPPGDKSYSQARRMLTFLDFFLPVSVDEVPRVSILREFVGGSGFQY